MTCGATAENHCCWVAGQVCQFFDPDPPEGAEGHCSLRTELGSWSAVHTDSRYLAEVRPTWDLVSMTDCGDWLPGASGGRTSCLTCGWDGS